MKLLRLFLEFLYVGLFSLGGGYATIPLIQDRIIDTHHWISNKEFIDIITISQMTPGPLTVNLSTFVGLKSFGVIGAFVATIGAAIIGVVLTVSIYASYKNSNRKKYWDLFLKSLRISSVAMISLATVSIFDLLLFPENVIDIKLLSIFGILLGVSVYKKLDTSIILLLSGIVGLLVF